MSVKQTVSKTLRKSIKCSPLYFENRSVGSARLNNDKKITRRKTKISYLVCHMEKYHKQEVSPVEEENERDETFEADNPQIDSERTKDNYHMNFSGLTYTEFINKRLNELGLRPRKDAVVMNSFVVGSDKAFFDGLSKIQRYTFFSDCAKFFEERYGQENVMSAVVHLDETTPHMHFNLIPITPDGRLCSKDLFDKPKLQQLQTDFYEAVGKKYGLQRGKEGSQAKHLSTAEYKAKKIIEEAEEIRRENQVYADALEEAKNGDIPKKRGKLQEQVVALTVANKDLTERLDRSMQDTLDMVKENGKLKVEKDKDIKYAQVGKYIASNAPNLCRNILSGASPTKVFFSAVEDLCKPSVTAQIPRLQQIEAEIEEERVKHERKNRNYKY